MTDTFWFYWLLTGMFVRVESTQEIRIAWRRQQRIWVHNGLKKCLAW